MELETFKHSKAVTNRLISACVRHKLWERFGELTFMLDLLESHEILTECEQWHEAERARKCDVVGTSDAQVGK